MLFDCRNKLNSSSLSIQYNKRIKFDFAISFENSGTKSDYTQHLTKFIDSTFAYGRLIFLSMCERYKINTSVHNNSVKLRLAVTKPLSDGSDLSRYLIIVLVDLFGYGNQKDSCLLLRCEKSE